MRRIRTRIPVARWPHRHRERLVAVDRRSQQVLLLAGATGARDHGTFVGMITAADLVELDEVLDWASRPPGDER